MGVQATFTKGNSVLSGDKTIAEKLSSIDGNDVEKTSAQVIGGSTKEVDTIVVNTVKAVKGRMLAIDRAASIITGRIRVKFVSAIRSHSSNSQFEYEIASFKYLDEILFDDLTDIIRSIIQFGSRSGISHGQVMKMIVDTAKLIEYFIPEEDYNDIRNILGVVYNEF